MNPKPVSYLQTDARWKNISYSAKGESTTIGRAGCGPTAMAMVLATWANKSITPRTEAAWALAHGYKYPHQGTAYTYFAAAAKRYGLTCKQITPAYIYGNANSPYHAQVKAALDNGDLVIACMGKGLWTSSGHYVLVYGISGNVVYINDPASSRAVRTQGSYALFKRQVKLYWIIKRPEWAKEKGDDMTEKETKALIDSALQDYTKTIKELITMGIHDREREIAKETEPDWSKKEGHWQRATEKKITDGTEPERAAKRDEVIAWLGRLGLL